LAALVGLLPEQLVMAEIYTFRPFKIPDSKLLYDIRSSDLVFAYSFPRGDSISFIHSTSLIPAIK